MDLADRLLPSAPALIIPQVLMPLEMVLEVVVQYPSQEPELLAFQWRAVMDRQVLLLFGRTHNGRVCCN